MPSLTPSIGSKSMSSSKLMVSTMSTRSVITATRMKTRWLHMLQCMVTPLPTIFSVTSRINQCSPTNKVLTLTNPDLTNIIRFFFRVPWNDRHHWCLCRSRSDQRFEFPAISGQPCQRSTSFHMDVLGCDGPTDAILILDFYVFFCPKTILHHIIYLYSDFTEKMHFI